MTVVPHSTADDDSGADSILPCLRSIGKAHREYSLGPADDETNLGRYRSLLRSCVERFKEDERYRDDQRFHKILILYGDAVQDFREVFEIMEERGIGIREWFIYDSAASFYIAKGELLEANRVFLLGISRKAEPIDKLKMSYSQFLDHLSKIRTNSDPALTGSVYVSPWTSSTITNLLEKMDPHIVKYNGYHRSNKNYSGNVSLSSLRTSSRNKTIQIGTRKYCIKGCAGQGGFALVFKASIENNPEDIVALKIQSPPFPWEFYMYRQLDQKISGLERSCFGYAHRVHIYSDRSILVSDYYSHGTLQDVINSYVVTGSSMDEILCIYYTIEMLQILENLHAVSLIHGDFKPDNLLIRYASTFLTEDSFSTRTGPWSEKGLCLIDWGRGIDLSLFPAGTEFEGDCASGFQCVEMQEKRPWTYQVDTYGLCVCVHMLLHGTYMIVEKKDASDGSSYYHPKSPFKRYWNKDLWSNFFFTLLNIRSNDNDVQVLQNLRNSFEDYLCKNPKLVYKLKDLLAKQKASLCK